MAGIPLKDLETTDVSLRIIVGSNKGDTRFKGIDPKLLVPVVYTPQDNDVVENTPNTNYSISTVSSPKEGDTALTEEGRMFVYDELNSKWVLWFTFKDVDNKIYTNNTLQGDGTVDNKLSVKMSSIALKTDLDPLVMGNDNGDGTYTFTSRDGSEVFTITQGGSSNVNWGNIGGTLSNQTDLQGELDNKSGVGHTHTASEITDFDTEVQNNNDVSLNTSARHTHSNKTDLDNYNPANFATSAQGSKADSALQSESDPTVPAHVKSITQQNINDWSLAEPNPSDTDSLPEGISNLYYTDQRVESNSDVSSNTLARHTHLNKNDLDSYDPNNFATSAQGSKADSAVQTESDPTVPVHVKSITSQNISDWNSAEANTVDSVNGHIGVVSLDTDDVTEGSNKYYTDTKVSNNSDVSANTTARHTHPNKTLLDTYDQTNTDIQDSVNHKGLTNNPHSVTKSQVGLGNVTDNVQIPLSQKGSNNGVAELDSNGFIPSSQLPAFVDDVLEYANQTLFPATGESGIIYIAADTGSAYRWTGSVYAAIGGSLTLGETSSTAYRGDRGKTAYDHSQLSSGNPHNVSKADVGLSNVDNTSDANKPISTAVQSALNGKSDTGHTHDTLSNVSSNKIIGRVTSGSGGSEELTPAQVRSLINVENGATADQTDAEIKTAYENNANTNAFTDAEKTVVGNTSGTNTGDQDLSGLQSKPSEGAFQDGDKTKLDGIEIGADVTDATNVNAAGATMNNDTNVQANNWVLDEDNMLSNSPTKVPTQQSVKAYVDVKQETINNPEYGNQTLTDGGIINWDMDNGEMAKITLGGDRLLNTPTNLKWGTYILIVQQDATGGRLLSFGSNFKWPDGDTPILSTAANAVDIITFVSDGTNLYGVEVKNFS